MRNRFPKHSRFGLALLLTGICFTSNSLYSANLPKGGESLQAGAQVVQFKPSLPQGSLMALPDNARVQLSVGRSVRVGDLRRLTALSKRMKSSRNSSTRLPTALRTLPASKGRPINTRSDISEALNLPDHETLQLPSGKRLTVAQLKFIQPLLEEQLGSSLKRSRDNSAAPIKVGPNADWKAILQKPDATRLQAPDGTLITVADIKQRLASEKAALPALRR